jgi:hypothetical protein
MNFLRMKEHKYTLKEVIHDAFIKLSNFNYPTAINLYNYLIRSNRSQTLAQGAMCQHDLKN